MEHTPQVHLFYQLLMLRILGNTCSGSCLLIAVARPFQRWCVVVYVEAKGAARSCVAKHGLFGALVYDCSTLHFSPTAHLLILIMVPWKIQDTMMEEYSNASFTNCLLYLVRNICLGPRLLIDVVTPFQGCIWRYNSRPNVLQGLV